MYYLHVSSNIMSLGGLALAIGVLVDAAIVMVENGYRQLSEKQAERTDKLPEAERRRILLDAAKQVGPAIFFSLLIIVVSFLPVFLLEAQEGRMFRPLAWTKTLAVGFSSLLAITLVPVLMLFFIRGRLRPESRNPLSVGYPRALSSGSSLVPSLPQNHVVTQPDFPRCHPSAGPEDWQPVYAAAI